MWPQLYYYWIDCEIQLAFCITVKSNFVNSLCSIAAGGEIYAVTKIVVNEQIENEW